MNLKENIKVISESIRKRPLFWVLIFAAIVRLIAVVYSKGYLAHDDHFCVIEDASELLRTGSLRFMGDEPHRSFFYPGAHYLLFKLFEIAGLYRPQLVMFFVRLLHALFSLFSVYFGYKLIEKSAGKKAAFAGGLLLSFYFIMPFLAVRQLIEHVSSVFLVSGVYFAYIFRKEKKYRDIFISGLLISAASIIRFQATVFFLTILVYFAITEKKRFVSLFLATGLIAILAQGLLDLALFGEFLATPINYIKFNLNNATSYISGPWYNYLLLIIAAFVPPFSFYMLWGIVKSRKLMPAAFYSTTAFFIMHSAFPGKQERFIFPIIPLIIILGISGIWIWKEKPGNEFLKKKAFKWSWIIFWILNTAVLIPVTLNYSQKARIAPLIYLDKKEDVSTIIFDETEVSPMLPYFYMPSRPKCFTVKKKENLAEPFKYLKEKSDKNSNNYVVIFTAEKLDKHLKMIQEEIPEGKLIREKLISPSLVDFMLHKMNPEFNKAKVSWIYRVEY